ncbi:hypothetical protein [Streptomyces sp. NPDC048172]|uniref:hypothetical protein n=1 Tax=Streptomyces sp. NPDC048172 TaxID=3365505 RepID=UPI003710CE8C
MSEGLRERLLIEHGPVTLRIGLPVNNTVLLRVLRTELGLSLVEIKSARERVLAGGYSGTLPEIEHLARRLRAAGIDATASRAGNGPGRGG